MNSSLKDDVTFQSNNSTLIKEIIGEMKYQFNKSEHKNGISKTETVEVEMIVNRVPKNLEKDDRKGFTKNENFNSEGLNQEHSNETGCEFVESEEESLLFKQPNDESLQAKNKRLSRKCSLYQKEKVTNVIKRSSRRRSKDSSESILQSAIARKEKSYNESNRPQRLSRKLKSTNNHMKILEQTKMKESQERSKKNSNSTKLSKKKLKKSKTNFNLETVLDSLENISATEPFKKTTNSDIINKNNTRGLAEDILCYNQMHIENQDTKSESVLTSGIDYEKTDSTICLCMKKTNLFADVKENEVMYCTAIDSIEEKLVGCTRVADVKNIPLLRPSRRVTYQILCELHKNRLILHNCCPICGIYCTQGRFVECEAKHHYHRKCQMLINKTECCPHCNVLTPDHDVLIRLLCDSKPIFLPSQKPNYPSAKMGFSPIKDEDISCRTSPPLLPAEAIRNLTQYEVNGKCFTENDLVEAVREENESKLAVIIASNSVNLKFKIADFNDGTLLHYAAFNGQLAVCHLILQAHLEIDEFDKEQNTPLMIAISANKNNVVKYLIRAGASTSIKGTDGMTPLHTAAKCGNIDAIKLILRSSTITDFINCQDDGGWTPLVWACEHGHVEIVSYLISNGANPHLRDVEFNEALHWAAFSGSCDVLEILLNTGCNVNTKNVQGETPLHIAAREDRTNCLIMLLSRGADVSISNNSNETPVDYVSVGSASYNILLLNLKLQSVIKLKGPKLKTILSNDISRGRESNPIQCVNAVDDEPVPTNFVYITKNCISEDDVRINKNIKSIHSCLCVDNCVTDNCYCGKKSKHCWYDEEGKLIRSFNFTDAPMIFECNDTCACNAITCRNRVVQKGITQRFQILKTEDRGWGLKTLRFIPKGTFVCEYIGEMLTDTEADTREDDSFLFALSNTETESFCVDAKQYGNMSRFINHCCSPNLFPIKLFVDHQDLRFPRIALFAQRDIVADEELSFDYGERYWLVKYKLSPCKCMSSECRYFKTELGFMDGCETRSAKDS